MVGLALAAVALFGCHSASAGSSHTAANDGTTVTNTVGSTTVLRVSGAADALAAGPVAYGQQWPIVLTASDVLPAATKQALDDLHVAHVIVVGGTAAVGDGVVQVLQASGRSVERIAGVNRMATATALAEL